ncbi:MULTISPECIES: helix-turn-helix transcriptional regulator [unclassified Paenibacillus]|uniref:helix-turn-helix transcriptional regulator n=1 Tax=unclassified Paenibacillus TaxID=185978 RepID=UPI003635E581
MRAERLLTLLLCLQHHGKMTTRQLAEKVEVSERTIARDMEALSAAGIPVFAFRGAFGGWSLSEGYRTNLTGLKIEEIQSLLLMNSSGIMNDLGLRSNFDTALLKLLASLPPSLQRDAEFMRERIHVDGAGWHQSQEAFPYLGIVQEAIWNEKKLMIEYPKNTTKTERLVEPLGLVAKASIWYLVARTNGEMRTFRISRIDSARIMDISFTRPDDFQLATYWEQSTQAFQATLPYYPAIVKIQEHLLPQFQQARYVKVKETWPAADSGWLLASVDFHTIESACEIILSYSPYLKVDEPYDLRLAVISRLQDSLAMYEI